MSHRIVSIALLLVGLVATALVGCGDDDALIRAATPGLFGRDLVDLDAVAEAGFSSATTTKEPLGYFLSVVYWFIEGRPDRMDEDRNGVPCETVHDPGIVAALWGGGEVG